MTALLPVALLLLLPLPGLYARNLPGLLPGMLGDVVEIVEITPAAGAGVDAAASRADWPFAAPLRLAPVPPPPPRVSLADEPANKVLLDIILGLRDQVQLLHQRQALLLDSLRCQFTNQSNCTAADALAEIMRPASSFNSMASLNNYGGAYGGFGPGFGSGFGSGFGTGFPPGFGSSFYNPGFGGFSVPSYPSYGSSPAFGGGFGSPFGSSFGGGFGSGGFGSGGFGSGGFGNGYGSFGGSTPGFGSGFGNGLTNYFGGSSSSPFNMMPPPMSMLAPGKDGVVSNFVSSSTVMGSDGKIHGTMVTGSHDKPPVVTSFSKEPGEKPTTAVVTGAMPGSDGAPSSVVTASSVASSADAVADAPAEDAPAAAAAA